MKDFDKEFEYKLVECCYNCKHNDFLYPGGPLFCPHAKTIKEYDGICKLYKKI